MEESKIPLLGNASEVQEEPDSIEVCPPSAFMTKLPMYESILVSFLKQLN